MRTLLLLLLLVGSGCAGEKPWRDQPMPPNTAVKLHPMEEFDGKSREDVLSHRAKRVDEYPALKRAFLGEEPYVPDERIFGAVESGRPWWGILGICYYGPGEKGPEGPSEESRFLSNPYLLVGLAEQHAHRVHETWPPPKAYYPKPESLEFRLPERKVRVRYDVSTFKKDEASYRCGDPGHVSLIAYNARDLGFGWMAVEPVSGGLQLHGEAGKIAKLVQFLHLGGSCGYPGGCNNMSPTQAPLAFRVQTVPAKLQVKLWREGPEEEEAPAAGSEPDLTVELELR